MIHTTNSINKIGSLGSLFFVKLASEGGIGVFASGYYL